MEQLAAEHDAVDDMVTALEAKALGLYLPISPIPLPYLSHTPPIHLPYTSHTSPIFLQGARAQRPPYISPLSPLHIPSISPRSPLHLPSISQAHGLSSFQESTAPPAKKPPSRQASAKERAPGGLSVEVPFMLPVQRGPSSTTLTYE